MNKILINAISARNGGGVTYIKNVLPYFIKNKGLNEISIIISRDNKELSSLKEINGLNILYSDIPSRNILSRLSFEIFKIPKIMKDRDFNILFSPGGTSLTLHSNAFQSITMFRNVWPYYYFNTTLKNIKNLFVQPKIFLNMLILKLVIAYNCKKLDKVIYISNHGYGLINNKRKPKNKARIITHAINPIYFQNNYSRCLYELETNRYILYVSSFMPYKNHTALIEAYAKSFEKLNSFPLVLIGKISPEIKDSIENQVDSLKIKEKVLILEEVNEETLSKLYQNSLFNLFLSSCENCPNTMLEAMASSRPLLSSSFDPMPEFGNNFVTYCNPECVSDLTSKLEFMISNIENLEIKALEAKNSILEKKGWEKTAIETFNFIIS